MESNEVQTGESNEEMRVKVLANENIEKDLKRRFPQSINRKKPSLQLETITTKFIYTSITRPRNDMLCGQLTI